MVVTVLLTVVLVALPMAAIAALVASPKPSVGAV
jgi:hypothetical protein